MGEIQTVVDRDNHLTLNTATGKITMDDMIQAAEGYLSEPPTSRVLWNLLEADGSEISSEEFERLSQVVSQRPVASMKRKIAVVVSRKLGYGLSRIFQIHAEISGVQAEYHIGYDLDEAMAWLNEEENE
jgi:hypothetical protein